MSTNILNAPFSIKNVPNDRYSVVNRERMESLADFVRRVRSEKGFSLSDVRRNSGLQIANSYVSRIENGEVTNVTPEKLKALAKGLQVSEDEIFAIVRGKPLNETEAVDAEMAHFASRVKKLTPQQRRDFQIAWRMANDLLDRLEKEKGQAGQK